jgi:hypothetical protein
MERSEENDAGEQPAGKKKADIKRLLLIGIPMLLAAIFLSTLDDEARILWFEDNTPTRTSARFFLFSGEKERMVRVKEERELRVEWESELKRGELYADIIEDGEPVASLRGARDRWSVDTEQNRSYRFIIRGERARGSFAISWETRGPEDENG